MVDAGYGKAAIPILLKAKELYVSSKMSPQHTFLYCRPFIVCLNTMALQTPCTLVIAKLTNCFLSSFPSGFSGK